MKKKFKIIAADAYADNRAREAKRILKMMKDLRDAMEDTPSGFLDDNDLGPLYEELLDSIQDFDNILDQDLLKIR